ncbi:general stress protein [Oryzifoliimicrobium ureilyticus]|uniref:general stress protein n=1 Tax=Oryzifoliimicrobium ureilyticus TaxID=3113724 RepID=UPI003F67661F
MKTVTGLFDDYSDASAAVSAMESAGVSSNDISIVSNNADGRYADKSNAAKGAGTGAGIGAAVGGAGGLLTGLGLMAIPGVGPVVAAQC